MSSLLRFLLLPFSWVYGFGAFLHNKLYDLQIKKSVSFEIPVIGVGNLSAGGTGKTPHVEYLVRLLYNFYDVGVLSRGYRRKTTGYLLAEESMTTAQVGDEPLQIKRKFPSVTVAVCEERVLGIPIMLLDNPSLRVILLDDAFQHRQVKPNLSILLTDYSKPFSRDSLLPAGRLRESMRGAARADIIVVTKCPLNLPLDMRIQLTSELVMRSDQDVYFSYVKYGPIYSLFNHGEKLTLEKSHSVLLICGIVNPEPLYHHLRDLAGEVKLVRFADHHRYSIGDLKRIQATVSSFSGEKRFLITTEKDAVRLLPFKEYLLSQQLEIYCIPIEVEFFEEDKRSFNEAILYFVKEQIDTLNRNRSEVQE